MTTTAPARQEEGGAKAAVRFACPEDVPRLAELYGAACEELAGARGSRLLFGIGGRPAAVEASFAGELSDALHQVVLGFVGPPEGRVAASPAGYGTCCAKAMEGGELIGSIEEIYVKPDARRLGVGRAIALSLLEWCRARGCTGVDAKALPGSRAMKSFFEGEGFTARLLIMHRTLG